ncbi:MAG TPA: [FeFe] hydrogenase H-cluster maturation GTPase HydF [Bacteroidales bacterium]|nr:[FeFe] hydrogenase H-cluster maturation GTPase HydF [Bacteroidales bacterium]
MKKGRENTPHIGIFGRRNNGKSSLINALAGQDIAIVSEHAGTTTDPVKKSFEITGFGPVILIDTAGIDDTGDLGNKRVEKSLKTLDIIDLGILVLNNNNWGDYEDMLINRFRDTDTPYIIVQTKSDLLEPSVSFIKKVNSITGEEIISFSALTKENYEDLIKFIKLKIPEHALKTQTMLGDIIKHGDIVLMITPIDVEAPEGRIILPQVQAIRDILDNDAIAIVLKEREIDTFLQTTAIKPALAITDSQVFVKADASVPADIPLTSFSIALARMKGDFENYLKGTPKISDLQDGDRVLMLESCTHHVSCDDIGRVKIARWINNYTGKKIHFDIVAGLDSIPRQISDYALVIQCGGCMITRKQLHNRLRPVIEAGIPVTNYGMAIAWVQGIYSRAIAPFLGEPTDGTEYL